MHSHPILVTDAAGKVGAIGPGVTEMLLRRGLKVRAMVRKETSGLRACRPWARRLSLATCWALMPCTAHLAAHLAAMAALHRGNRYDRHTDTVEQLTGAPPLSVQEFIGRHASAFSLCES